MWLPARFTYAIANSGELLARLAELELELRPCRRPRGEQDAWEVWSAIDGDLAAEVVACSCGYYAGPLSSCHETIQARRALDGWELEVQMTIQS